MLVTVWRHGEAGAAPRDRDRALTPKGVDALGRAVLRFQETIGAKSLPRRDECYDQPLAAYTTDGGYFGGSIGREPTRRGLAVSQCEHR